jgi:hypothetical protein
MTTLTQGIQPLEFLLSEGEGQISRDEVTVTVAGAVALPSGQVLGKITATGKYVAYASGATDGSQTAVAVLGTPLDGVNGDYKALVFSRYCEVIGDRLDGGTAPNATVIGELAAVGIIVR